MMAYITKMKPKKNHGALPLEIKERIFRGLKEVLADSRRFMNQ